MKDKIIIVEDDDLIRRMVELNLNNEGYEMKGFSSGKYLIDYIISESCDLMILDMNLPDMKGHEILQILRNKGYNFPVIMLTVDRSIDSKRSAFENGADDYLTKPFSIEELILRVSALIRRAQSQRNIPAENIITINNYKVNLSTRLCNSNFGEFKLSDLEVRLLKHMVENTGIPLSRADLLEEVWGMESDSTPRTIDNFILKFRKLFEIKKSSPIHFISVRGKGYMYVDK